MSNYVITNGELRHWGIKGMKWGVRRYQNKDGSLTPAGEQHYADKAKKQSMQKDAKNRRLLSDADLKKKIERIKLERELKNLTAEEITPGRKAISSVLSSSGQKVASAFVTGAALYIAKAAMERKFDIKEMAGYMTPKPKNK